MKKVSDLKLSFQKSGEEDRVEITLTQLLTKSDFSRLGSGDRIRLRSGESLIYSTGTVVEEPVASEESKTTGSGETKPVASEENAGRFGTEDIEDAD